MSLAKPGAAPGDARPWDRGARAWTILPLVAAVRAYQWTLSGWLGGQCRYHPTCSHYAIEALREYGPLRGVWMAARRLARCHPFARGGYDPVPPSGPCIPSAPDDERACAPADNCPSKR